MNDTEKLSPLCYSDDDDDDDADLRDLIGRVIDTVHEKDFAFDLAVSGLNWRVYRFLFEGRATTIAMRDEGAGPYQCTVIGTLQSGHLEPEEVRRILASQAPN